MIWSVSTSTRSSGTAIPVWRVNDLITLLQLSNVDEVPGDRRCRSHRRAHKMCPAQLSLPPLEISIGGRGASLAGLQDVRVHPQTHGAARLAPVEAGLAEHPTE